MATVLDVARYILEKRGELDTMRLQKLCYYAQAWHLAWEDRALFAEDFEAWKDGPVCMPLYVRHRRCFSVYAEMVDGSSAALTEAQRRVVDEVLRVHGSKSGAELSGLTHREGPWCDARGTLGPKERSRTVIEKAAMQGYFQRLGAGRGDWDSEPLGESVKRFIANRRDLLKRLA